MREKNIITLTILFLVVCGIYFLAQSGSLRRQQIVSRCIGYDPQWNGMEDCYGVISIWSDRSSPKYYLTNNIKPGWFVAEINAVDDFSIKNGNMYLIDASVPGVCNNLEPDKYCGEFQVAGEPKTYYYNTPEEIPNYLIIDTKNGDERFYARLQDVPSADQIIFQNLK